MRDDFQQEDGHSSDLDQKRSGILSVKIVHKENGAKRLKGCCWNWKKVIVQFSALQAQCPEVDSKAKDMENCRYTMQPIWKRLNLSHKYFCKSAQSLRSSRGYEDYESLHERTERPDVMGQSSSSFVPSVIMTEVPLHCDDPANRIFLLQQYGERIEKLSQQDKLSKIYMDAGFLKVVEIGQYFMTKGTGRSLTISCSGLS